jgi:hypothetical protein
VGKVDGINETMKALDMMSNPMQCMKDVNPMHCMGSTRGGKPHDRTHMYDMGLVRRQKTHDHTHMYDHTRMCAESSGEAGAGGRIKARARRGREGSAGGHGTEGLPSLLLVI